MKTLLVILAIAAVVCGKPIEEKQQEKAQRQEDICGDIVRHYASGRVIPVSDCIVVGNSAFYRIDEFLTWSSMNHRCSSYDERSKLASIRNFRELAVVRLLMATEKLRKDPSNAGPSYSSRKWIGLKDCVFSKCWTDNGDQLRGKFGRANNGYRFHGENCGYASFYKQDEFDGDNELLGMYDAWRTVPVENCNWRYQGICKFNI